MTWNHAPTVDKNFKWLDREYIANDITSQQSSYYVNKPTRRDRIPKDPLMWIFCYRPEIGCRVKGICLLILPMHSNRY